MLLPNTYCMVFIGADRGLNGDSQKAFVGYIEFASSASKDVTKSILSISSSVKYSIVKVFISNQYDTRT